jgi:hypothetical protein
MGGGVDQDVRPRGLKSGDDGAAVLEVERRPAERDHLNA